MRKAGKICLGILSWGPLVWTVLILVAAKFCYTNHSTYSVFYPMKDYFLLSALVYVFVGFFIWLILLVLLKWQKVITTKQLILHVGVTAAGLIFAYTALSIDLFNVSGGYID